MMKRWERLKEVRLLKGLNISKSQFWFMPCVSASEVTLDNPCKVKMEEEKCAMVFIDLERMLGRH